MKSSMRRHPFRHTFAISTVGMIPLFVSATIIAAELPPMLDSLYPPATPMPVYLIKMHELATPMSAIASNVMEGDLPNAQMHLTTFRQKYIEIGALVPEWSAKFPNAPVDDLAAALEVGSPDRIMPAIGAVGAVCADCHHESMAAAQHRYHWDDFSRINVGDPLSGQDMSFAQFMMAIESDMSGIGIDAQEGQLENAHQHAKGLKARMSALRDACVACHETERHYYVDASILSALDSVNAAIAATPPRMQQVQESLMQVGQESCFKCHLVHIPAAYSKH
jgi:cytochrome c556